MNKTIKLSDIIALSNQVRALPTKGLRGKIIFRLDTLQELISPITKLFDEAKRGLFIKYGTPTEDDGLEVKPDSPNAKEFNTEYMELLAENKALELPELSASDFDDVCMDTEGSARALLALKPFFI